MEKVRKQETWVSEQRMKEGSDLALKISLEVVLRMEGRIGIAEEVIEGLEASLADTGVARVIYLNEAKRGYKKLD